MFSKSPDERLSAWSRFRRSIETSTDPLLDVANFWYEAPRVEFNRNLDPYNSRAWPTPWEIIFENKYDDLTVAVMMGYSLKLTKRFQNDKIEVKTMVDNSKKQLYNLLYINEIDVLNFDPAKPVKVIEIPDHFYLENCVEILDKK